MTVHNVMPGFLHVLKMLNQLIKFAPKMVDGTKSTQNLLSTKISELGDMLNEAFKKAKSMLSSNPVIVLFDPNLKTI